MHFINGFGGYFEAHGKPEPLTYVALFSPTRVGSLYAPLRGSETNAEECSAKVLEKNTNNLGSETSNIYIILNGVAGNFQNNKLSTLFL